MNKQWKDVPFKEDFKTRFGVSVSTARTQLINRLMFDMIVQLNKNTCFRCHNAMTVKDFSIEHVIPWAWEENAHELFMDVNNITFSHRRCNSAHGRNTKRKQEAAKHRRKFDDDLVKCGGECGLKKNRSEFHKNSREVSGVDTRCKPCRAKFRLRYK
jgi:hypothetical protein